MSRQRPTLGRVTNAVERVAARYAAVAAVHAEAIAAAQAQQPQVTSVDHKTGEVTSEQ